MRRRTTPAGRVLIKNGSLSLCLSSRDALAGKESSQLGSPNGINQFVPRERGDEWATKCDKVQQGDGEQWKTRGYATITGTRVGIEWHSARSFTQRLRRRRWLSCADLLSTSIAARPTVGGCSRGRLRVRTWGQGPGGGGVNFHEIRRRRIIKCSNNTYRPRVPCH